MASHEDWLEEALVDLASAEKLGSAGLYSRACFHCQQAVEKALKALIIRRRDELVKTHSLRELAETAGELKELSPLITDLDADYTASRYVDLAGRLTSEIYDKEKFEKRLDSAKSAIDLVKKWIIN